MDALRIQDVKEKLHNKVIIENHGVINTSVGESILFKRFIAINDMNKDERKKLDIDTLQKYQTIVSSYFQSTNHRNSFAPTISIRLFLMIICFW